MIQIEHVTRAFQILHVHHLFAMAFFHILNVLEGNLKIPNKYFL